MISDRELIDILTKEVAKKGRRPPAARCDDLCKRSAGAKKIGGEAPAEPMPREVTETHVLADFPNLGDLPGADRLSSFTASFRQSPINLM